MDVSSTPSIRVTHSPRYPSPPRRPPSYPTYPIPASPMSIPNSSQDPSPPPPLPPPRINSVEELGLVHEPAWTFTNNPSWTGFARQPSVKPGSSLLGRRTSAVDHTEKEHINEEQNEEDFARRGSSISTITPAQREYQDMDGSRTPSDDGPSSVQLPSYR